MEALPPDPSLTEVSGRANHIVALPESATRDDLHLAALVAVALNLRYLFVAWTIDGGPTTAPPGSPSDV